MPPRTRRDLLDQLRMVAPSARRARQALDRALGLAGVPRTDGPLSDTEMLLICEALASEGGAVQRLAESIAAGYLAGPSPAADVA